MLKLFPVMLVIALPLVPRAILDATARWNGQLPANVSGLWLLPSDLWTTVLGWMKSEPATKK